MQVRVMHDAWPLYMTGHASLHVAGMGLRPCNPIHVKGMLPLWVGSFELRIALPNPSP
jgi:hypothetical protein